ncbi:MAG TPA: YceI family protein [Burkholderiales bacterium]|nr:YceI family protein [Burkholderiales bacterium]
MKKAMFFLIAAMALQAGIAEADGYKVQNGNPSGTFKIDPVHSMVEFWIGHLGVSEFPGRFDTITGSFTVDDAHPAGDKVSVEVPIESLDTNFDKRNKDLLGPDFFNAVQFPKMTFTSSSVTLKDGKGELVGNLTLHGVTRKVRFSLQRIGAGPDPWGGYRSGYVAKTVIHRSDFGMNYMLNGIADAIEVQLNIEGKRQ